MYLTSEDSHAYLPLLQKYPNKWSVGALGTHLVCTCSAQPPEAVLQCNEWIHLAGERAEGMWLFTWVSGHLPWKEGCHTRFPLIAPRFLNRKVQRDLNSSRIYENKATLTSFRELSFTKKCSLTSDSKFFLSGQLRGSGRGKAVCPSRGC